MERCITNNLRDWRRKRDLTQAELAAKANVSPNYIWMLEKGKRRLPSDEVMLRLAEVLQARPSDLFSVGC